MKIPVEVHKRVKQTVKAMHDNRQDWWTHWRELAEYILPRRYVWLETDRERTVARERGRKILDGTGTQAARTLASGMMNGITSPSRPWFKLRVPGFYDEDSGPVAEWLDDTVRRMLLVMAESNFYNSVATMYLDLSVFGTASALIYDDPDNVIRCYNNALGEYYLAQDSRQQVNTFGRTFSYKVHQVVERWGLENCSKTVQDHYNAGGDRQQINVQISHLIEPNRDGPGKLAPRFKFREYYWETNGTDGESGSVLEVGGFREMPGIFPRWELQGNDAYGTSPAMDALPDIKQLQHETKAKANSLDYMNNPPLLADAALRHRPKALMPRGVTYVQGANSFGAKPAYTVNPPLQELALDIQDIRQRIREIFHNDLFKMISQLDTVRSAAEIGARREEKLVLLGPVLERFENEALDPAISRIFHIMSRRGLILPPPDEIQGAVLEVQYVGILAEAQKAVGTAAHEQFASYVGNLAAVAPSVLEVPNWPELVRDYGERIGVPSRAIRTREEFEEAQAAQQESQAVQQAAEVGPALTGAAKQLSDTNLGGGQSALRELLGA